VEHARHADEGGGPQLRDIVDQLLDVLLRRQRVELQRRNTT
jgi:hypothetical protein